MLKRVLIVEDNRAMIRNLNTAVRDVMPTYIPGFSGRHYDIATSLESARRLIARRKYGLILLDHQLPMTDQNYLKTLDFLHKPKTEDAQIDLKCEDILINMKFGERYRKSLRNIGYSLIPEIRRKQPNKCVIIGTSTLSADEIGAKLKPDYLLDKFKCFELAGILQRAWKPPSALRVTPRR